MKSTAWSLMVIPSHWRRPVKKNSFGSWQMSMKMGRGIPGAAIVKKKREKGNGFRVLKTVSGWNMKHVDYLLIYI